MSVMKVNYRLKAIILEVVENQMRLNEPKATKETFERLLSKGYDEKAVKEMIASVIAEEMWHMLTHNRVFNEEEFSRKLAKLE